LATAHHAERVWLELCLEMITVARAVAILGLIVGAYAAGVRAQAVEGAEYDRAPVRLDESVTGSRRPVTPIDLLTLRDPKGVSMSPDGKQIAFVVGQADYETNGYRSGLFVVDTRGGIPVRPLGTVGIPHWDDINQWIDEAPEWSPDGMRISYRTKMDAKEHWQVSVWNLATGEREKVTSVSGDVESYRWCLGGSSLFLTSTKPRSSPDTRNAEEKGVLFNRVIHPYQVIPILTQMEAAKESGREYWIYDLKTERERPATQAEIAEWGPWNADSAPSDPNSALANYHIIEGLPSPDRSKAAYLYALDTAAQSKTWSVRLLVATDRDRNVVEVTPEGHRVEQFWWTADGSTLLYTEHRGRGHSPELWAFRPSESKSQLIYKAAGREYLSSFSSDDAGRVFACLVENNTSPPLIAVMDGAAQQVRTLVDLNPEFAFLEMGKTERLEGTNSYGEDWFAYLVRPPDFVPGKKYPLIVTTYRSGDYFLRGASGDENPIQVYAAHGFAVLSFDVGWLRNPVGGDFNAKILDWASPVASIEDAVERLTKEEIVDPARVGIAGYSHGEEIAGYAVTHTNSFKAASGAAGYDPCFYFLGSEEWHEVFEEWGLGGWPEGKSRENWQRIAMSTNADKVVTPILQNASDTEYLIYLPLYRSLADLGRPIELYLYPNELHVRNQPRHRLEIYERNLDWFRFWLKQEQDSDPGKTEQYQRWNHLRDELKRALENSSAFPHFVPPTSK
jgi:dipeptidyl aminopeptidase/acylaminoacyl peptidase